ncbi:MAG: DoxX subfamily [Candidatus Aminicenantes bacterium]|mgnify:CR=1 FL=1|nr:MAG: DoxX subfamily [Candidatus Aminicenantes bacterium]
MQPSITHKPAQVSLKPSQLYLLTFLRVLIGWHFLYEGLAKLFNPYWSSADYLMQSKWIFSGLFKALMASPTLLKIVDWLNIWGLMLIGLALMLGLGERVACWAGAVLLLLYYLAAPPFVGYNYSLPQEGSYVIVNKNLIELAALLVLSVFRTSRHLGLEYFLNRKKVSSAIQAN